MTDDDPNSDLIERLRSFWTFDSNGCMTTHPICDEAADEIEQLRATLQEKVYRTTPCPEVEVICEPHLGSDVDPLYHAALLLEEYFGGLTFHKRAVRITHEDGTQLIYTATGNGDGVTFQATDIK